MGVVLFVSISAPLKQGLMNMLKMFTSSAGTFIGHRAHWSFAWRIGVFGRFVSVSSILIVVWMMELLKGSVGFDLDSMSFGVQLSQHTPVGAGGKV